jgi:Flp pilus assembly protein TadG
MKRAGESTSRVLAAEFPAECAGKGLRRLKGECGSTLIEYALVLILFLTMLFGIMGFGLALYAYHFVSNEAKEAARWAAVNGSTCADDGSCNGTNGMSDGPASEADIQNYVNNHVPMGIDSSKVKVTWPNSATGCPTIGPCLSVCATTPDAPGCTVQVTVSYDFHFIFPLIDSNPLTLSSTSEMVIAH